MDITMNVRALFLATGLSLLLGCSSGTLEPAFEGGPEPGGEPLGGDACVSGVTDGYGAQGPFAVVVHTLAHPTEPLAEVTVLSPDAPAAIRAKPKWAAGSPTAQPCRRSPASSRRSLATAAKVIPACFVAIDAVDIAQGRIVGKRRR